MVSIIETHVEGVAIGRLISIDELAQIVAG
jgi:hypothetical protein